MSDKGDEETMIEEHEEEVEELTSQIKKMQCQSMLNVSRLEEHEERASLWKKEE